MMPLAGTSLNHLERITGPMHYELPADDVKSR